MDILKIGIGITFGSKVAIMVLLSGICAGNYDDQPQASLKWQEM